MRGSAWLGPLFASVCLALAACEGSAENTARPALTREELMNPETCKDCHPKHYAEWSASMHAYASTDPVFLAMNKRGQEETNGSLQDFCVKCHMPMAVAEQKIPDLTNLESVPEHLQGVTCYFCHNAVSVGSDHFNGNIQLAHDTTMRAAINRAQIPSVHKVAFSDNHNPSSLNSSIMCGTCHDIVNQQNFPLEKTLQEYMGTFLASSDPSRFQSCQNCHMGTSTQLAAQSSGFPGVPTGQRNVHEHLFAAVDTPLTPFPGDVALRQAVEQCELPKSLAFYDVALASPLGDFQVQIETQAGHAQPSGATQDRRLWLEVDYYDDAGNLMYSDGVIPDGQVEEPAGGPRHPCMMRDRVANAEGEEAHMFWEAASQISTNLIPPPTNATPGTHTLLCRFQPRQFGKIVPRIDLRLRMRPVGLDVLQDLVNSGHLAEEILAKMPTYTVDTRTALYNKDLVPAGYTVNATTPKDCTTYKTLLDPELQGGAAGSGSVDTAGRGL